MKKLFQLLFDGCIHNYEVFEENDYTQGHRTIGTIYRMRCEKCSKTVHDTVFNG